MKKLFIFFVFTLVLGMIFPSCSNNDDSSNSNSNSVVGKWNFSKISLVVDGVASPETDYDDNESGCPKDYLEFKSGGVYNEGDYDGSACLLDVNVGTWVQTGNTITITEGTDVITAAIVSVTSSMLKLKASETDNGVTFVANVTFTKA